ncbi:MAG: protein kinase [Candidatus Aminicenantes bacterium]
MIIKCPQCDTDNPSDSKFCKECATPLPKQEDEVHTKTAETPKEELTTGSTFAGRYQIIEELGKGGMGKVYKALDKDINEKVALKLIKPEISADKNTIKRFQNELKYARKISHRNVCRMYDLNKEKGNYYITMEYVSGEDLKSFIRRAAPLSTARTVSIAKQICEGLAEAHGLEVVHRDLKPSNIMIDDHGNARIMDFGIARTIRGEGITGSGVMIGTPEYMSPEQAEVKEVDQRSDIYSLGVILYEMVTGRIPFEGETPLGIAMKHKNEIPKDPKELNAQIPDNLSRVILRCLEKEKENRYQSAGEVLSVLTRIEEGIPTTERVEPKKKPPTSEEITVTFKKQWALIAVPLVIFLAAALFFLLLKKGKEGLPSDNQKIIVLPFENLGPAEDEYFADVIADEIRGRLSVLHSLDVISRDTAILYKKSGKTAKQIRQETNADYILGGTVLWVKKEGKTDRVRITPHLTRAMDDIQLWSEAYDQDIEDIIAVQSEIAGQVIQKLDITLLGPESRALKVKPTENIEAYNAFLRGIHNLNRTGSLEESYRLAVQMLELAVELDPSFALAFAELSYAHSLLYHYEYDRTEERIFKAKAAVERAFGLQPGLPEAHLYLGCYYYLCHKDYDRALEELAVAEKDLPNDNRIPVWKAAIRRRQGRFEEAVRYFKKAAELSPQDSSYDMDIALTYTIMRGYPAAESYYNRAISVAPDRFYIYIYKAYNYWLWEGKTERARATLEKVPQKVDPMAFYYWFWQEIYERNYKAALDLLSSLSSESLSQQTHFIPKAQFAGYVYRLMNKPELARTSYDSARILLEREVKERPGDPRVHKSLGIVYAALGRREEAVQEGMIAVELQPISKDAYSGPNQVETLARIFVKVGDYEAALDKIEYLLSIPSWLSVPMLRLDPDWDPLRTHPRFQKLLKQHSKVKRR